LGIADALVIIIVITLLSGLLGSLLVRRSPRLLAGVEGRIRVAGSHVSLDLLAPKQAVAGAFSEQRDDQKPADSEGSSCSNPGRRRQASSILTGAARFNVSPTGDVPTPFSCSARSCSGLASDSRSTDRLESDIVAAEAEECVHLDPAFELDLQRLDLEPGDGRVGGVADVPPARPILFKRSLTPSFAPKPGRTRARNRRSLARASRARS
jgi:hypothetical protein